MKSLLSLTLFVLFALALGLEGKKQLVYCVHIDKGDIHLEVAHVDCSIKRNEIHLKALEDLNLNVEKVWKLVSVFYSVSIKKDFHSFPFPALERLRIYYISNSPLSSVKLLI